MSVMPDLVPNRFLFKFEFPLYRCARPPQLDGRLDDWDERYLLPALPELDGANPFGRVLITWDDNGLYIGCAVAGKTRLPNCDPARFRQSDNLRLMTDLRDTRTIRRASRFCQQFYFLPRGGGDGAKEAIAGSAKIRGATQDAPLVAPGQITVVSRVERTGYGLTAHVSARALHGFDPTENPRIGLYYMLEDGELGKQYLTVGDDLNWWLDPSTWPTAVLTK